VFVIVAGFVSLGFLQSRGWFEIDDGDRVWKGVSVAATLATFLAIPVILVDLTVGFPRDLNIPAPRSLLFYPAMAFVAEVVFHAIPLGLLLGALGMFHRPRSADHLVWLCFCRLPYWSRPFSSDGDFPGSRCPGWMPMWACTSWSSVSCSYTSSGVMTLYQ